MICFLLDKPTRLQRRNHSFLFEDSANHLRQLMTEDRMLVFSPKELEQAVIPAVSVTHEKYVLWSAFEASFACIERISSQLKPIHYY